MTAARRRVDPAAWRSEPAGRAAYEEARRRAQARANESGLDQGVEAQDLYRAWTVFALPAREHRSGHELRCEVVSCEDLTKCRPGHGPGFAG